MLATLTIAKKTIVLNWKLETQHHTMVTPNVYKDFSHFNPKNRTLFNWLIGYITIIMERHTEIAEDPPGEAPMETRSEFTKTDKMFTAKDILQIVKKFQEADTDGVKIRHRKA